MAQNLDIGNMIDGSSNQTNNGTIENIAIIILQQIATLMVLFTSGTK